MPTGRRPQPPRRGAPIRARMLRQVANAPQRILVPDGGRVRRIGTNLVIETPRTSPGPAKFLAEITGVVDQGNNRYRYNFAEVTIDTLDAFTRKTDGRSGTVADGNYALNGFEANNTGEGIEGNGIDVDNLPAGYSFGPIAVFAVVEITMRTLSDGSRRATFHAPNPVDGTCP